MPRQRNGPFHIAIDFDQTLHDREHPVPGKVMGEPLPGAVEAVRRLLSLGYQITVFTARGDLAGHVTRWLDFYGFPPGLMVTDVKRASFDLIVDDKAVQFTSWADFRLPERLVRAPAPGRPRPSRR